MPNYKDDEVLSAVRKLAKVSPFSFYFYSGPMYAYNLKNGKVLNEIPASFPNVPEEVNGKKNAHSFMTLLCGEFRDRPSLIRDKIKWVNRMNYMPIEDQKPISVNERNLWSKVSANSYNLYIENTRNIFAAKQQFLKEGNQIAVMGKHREEYPVDPFTVCETKFIFQRYVQNKAIFGRRNTQDFEAVGKLNSTPNRSVASDMSLDEIYKALDEGGKKYYACVEAGTAQDACLKEYQESMAPYIAAEEEYYAKHHSEEEGEEEFENFNTTKTKMFRKQPLFDKYQKEYTKFKKQCSKEDLSYFYDFRGDSNFKPNSPESNGMIWFSSSIGNSCTRVNGKMVLKAKVKDKFQDPEICEKYFSAPFAYRWSAARAGLATWVLHDKAYDETYAESNMNVTVIPNENPMAGPFAYQFREREEVLEDFYSTIDKNEKDEPAKWVAGKYVVLTGADLEQALAVEEQAKKDYEVYKADFLAKQAAKKPMTNITEFLPDWMKNSDKFWGQADFGFNSVVQFIGDKQLGNKELAYERLRDSVNRHTDWYASAYDDGLGTYREQAYSPFVASSYEMSASNAFTAPGTTVSSPADGCKHWMFVFKLKLENWYNTKSIMDKRPVNFNQNWFDETSLGTNGLADSEHALDRLGTALEGEMDSILYLHNINTSGQVEANCGRQAIEDMYVNKVQ